MREMEEHGLVVRKDYREIPPRVEYSLSELGKSLESVLLAMHEWGEKNASKRVLALSMDDVLID